MTGEWEPCDTYCEHGGVCELASGHEGLHDSRYCQWADRQAISRSEADRRLLGKPGGAEVLKLQQIVEAAADVIDGGTS